MSYIKSLFFMPLLVGVIFAIVAFIMLKFPPKKINYMYGYRTKSSMKTQKRWGFAQIYSSKLMIYCSLGLMISAILGLFIHVSEGEEVLISTVFIIIAVALLIYKTEKTIKQNFTND